MGDFMNGLLQNILTTVIVAAVTWWITWRTQQRRIHKLQAMVQVFEQQRGEHEVALILSAREDIKQAVCNHLASEGRQSIPLFQVHAEGMFSDNEDDWMNYASQIRKKVREIREQAVTRVYLYTNVPVVMGVFAGAILDNGPEVVVMHYFSGAYKRVGKLAQETITYA